jgi:hypothetical protein
MNYATLSIPAGALLEPLNSSSSKRILESTADNIVKDSSLITISSVPSSQLTNSFVKFDQSALEYIKTFYSDVTDKLKYGIHILNIIFLCIRICQKK